MKDGKLVLGKLSRPLGADASKKLERPELGPLESGFSLPGATGGVGLREAELDCLRPKLKELVRIGLEFGLILFFFVRSGCLLLFGFGRMCFRYDIASPGSCVRCLPA